MFDIKKIQDQAKKEYADEKATKAKQRIKGKLIEIDQAKQVLKNLEREYQDLLEEISDQE